MPLDLMQQSPMQTIIPGLYASAPEPLPFGRSLVLRAFLLSRKPGNLLVYSANNLAGEAQAIRDHGGITRHYLNHWHESAFGIDKLADAFGVPVFCHEDDAAQVSAKSRVAGTFSERHMLDGDFEVVPIPGHTPGATAFLWHNGEHRCLFTGDTIFLQDGEWVAAVLESSDRAAYIRSLELVRELDFNLLVPWIATAGQAFHAVTDRADAQRRIDAILARLRRGENH